MNQQLKPEEIDQLLVSLEGALILARLACYEGNAKKAEDIVDAFHNVPRLLLGPQPGRPATSGWTVKGFINLFLEGLLGRYPELRGSMLDPFTVPRH
jgi:hypothetical protein